MGKKNRRKNKKVSANGKPFVSVCTPTYNRRMFIPQLIKCFQKQTYPKELMEWIIIDDGDDSVEDLFKGVECVKYFRYEEKIKLGRKRNLMHEKSKGEIIVYMDDDDYYPPDRVTHAVDRLRARPNALAAGSSVVYIYFNDIDTLYQFGPYGPNHATAGTFAFKRKLLEQTRYDDDAEIAEEKAFLKNYTIPFAQLDPRNCILVFAHQYNTFDKRKLLENPHPDYVKKTNMSPALICRDAEMLKFYKSI
jgi:glycosyltransferase involved in cell wall biosynthesis